MLLRTRNRPSAGFWGRVSSRFQITARRTSLTISCATSSQEVNLFPAAAAIRRCKRAVGYSYAAKFSTGVRGRWSSCISFDLTEGGVQRAARPANSGSSSNRRASIASRGLVPRLSASSSERFGWVAFTKVPRPTLPRGQSLHAPESPAPFRISFRETPSSFARCRSGGRAGAWARSNICSAQIYHQPTLRFRVGPQPIPTNV